MICNKIPKKLKEEAGKTLLNFVNSMWVTIFDTRLQGNIPAPSFYVYMSENIINKIKTWCHLRNYFASKKYKIIFQNPENNKIPQCTCGICHRADHPRGLCPFSNIQNWNGLIRNKDPPLKELEGEGKIKHHSKTETTPKQGVGTKCNKH